MAAISKNIVSRKMRYLNRYLIFFLEHTVAIIFFQTAINASFWESLKTFRDTFSFHFIRFFYISGNEITNFISCLGDSFNGGRIK
jgi:hypothetical protein